MAYKEPYLSMYSTATQAIAVADTEQLVTFDTTVISKKIAVTSSSRFTVNEAGNYNCIVNFQLKGSGSNKIHSLWLKVDGTNVAYALSQNEIVNANDTKDITFAFQFPMAAGQYLEVWMSGTATSLQIQSIAAAGTPTRPAAASTVLRLFKLP